MTHSYAWHPSLPYTREGETDIGATWLSILHNTDSIWRERRMRNMTRSYTWHPSLSCTREGERDICATWLSILHNTDSIWRERLVDKGDIPLYLAQHWPLLSILHNTDSIWRERRMRCMTHSYTETYVLHDSFIYVTPLSILHWRERHMCNMTHWYRWHPSLSCTIHVIQFVTMWERETYVQHDSFIYVTSLSILLHDSLI